MLVYLAHPIDQASPGTIGLKSTRLLGEQIDYIKMCVAQQGWSSFTPGSAFTIGGPVDRADLRIIDEINNAALFESDVFIALLPDGVPTLGTVVEIEAAAAFNKPMLILTDRSVFDRSVQLASWQRRGISVLASSIGDPWPEGLWPEINHGELASYVRQPDSMRDDTKVEQGHPPTVVALAAGVKMPSRAYPGDAGLDLAALTEIDIHPGEYVLIPTGVRAALPDGWWGFMHGRSSAWSKNRLDVRTAIIDSGYRGELMIGVTNKSGKTVRVNTGDRLAQYVLMPAYGGELVEMPTLPEHDRGDNGYGSSGA